MIFSVISGQTVPIFPLKPALTVDPKTAKSAIEILAKWRFSAPRGGQKGGCRMTRLADFELNFEDEIRKKPGGIHRAIRIEWWCKPVKNKIQLTPHNHFA
jgi:hypothetical protein